MRPQPLARLVAVPLGIALLCAACARAPAPGLEAGPRAAEQLARTEQASERALQVLVPRVKEGIVTLESSWANGLDRLHVPSLDGIDVDLAMDALAGAFEGRPPVSGLDIAGAQLVARVRAYRIQARTPGLAWGGGHRLASLESGPSPAERAAASLRAVERSARALQAALRATREKGGAPVTEHSVADVGAAGQAPSRP